MNIKITKKAILPLIAFGLLSLSTSSFAKKEVKMEKCLGLAKAGMGDGKVTLNGKEKEWLYVPAGQCQKLIGGEVYIDKK